jgi:hypothetical protein
MPRQRAGVRYTVEAGRDRKIGGGRLSVDRIIVNGKTVGHIEYILKGGHASSRTCSRKLKTCKKGRDLVWLLEVSGLMGARALASVKAAMRGMR